MVKWMTVGVVVVLALAGCGGSGQIEAAGDRPTATGVTGPAPPLGPSATGDAGQPTPVDRVLPVPCVLVEDTVSVPDLPGAPQPGQSDGEGSVSAPVQRDHAVAIVLEHPGWEDALTIGRASLVMAVPWLVENQVERGVMLAFEFDEPVDLPTDVGMAATTERGEGGQPIYEDGVPRVDPVPAGTWDGSRSATLLVDLVNERLHEVTAGEEPYYCFR